MNNPLLFLAALSLWAAGSSVQAAIEINGSTTYVENFNSLPAAAARAEFNWTDDVTIRGFYFHRSNAPAGQSNLAGSLTTPGSRPYIADGSVTPSTAPNFHGFLSLGESFISDTQNRMPGFTPTTSDGTTNWSGGELSMIAMVNASAKYQRSGGRVAGNART